MLRTLIGILYVLALGLSAAYAQEKKSPQWAAVGLNVSKKAPGDDPSGASGSQHTSLKVRLRISAGMIAGVDLKKSTVTMFSDDQNTDLLRNQEKPLFGVASHEIALDGQNLFVTIRASALAAPNAKKLHVKGVIAIDFATNEKTLEMKDVSLIKGVDLGFAILQLSKPARPTVTGGLSVSETAVFTGNRPVKTSVFLDPKGNEIPIQNTFRRETRNAKTDNPYSMHVHFGRIGVRMVERVDRCSIRVTYFEKIERRMVPLDLEVGLGF